MLARPAAGALLVAAMATMAAAQGAPSRTDSTRRVRPGTPMAPAATPPTDSVRATPPAAVIPQPDQARGIDAEVRIAFDELYAGRTIPALSRVSWLNAAPIAFSGVGAAGALRGREDLLFLLAESYYRLGLDSAFRATADPLVSGATRSGRYAAALRQQLLLAAYRGGDFARVAALAKEVDAGEGRGLGALVTGLAAYQARDFAAARTAFAAAQQGGSAYASYAAYMDALTTLRGDTTQTAAALSALRGIAERAAGEFADQVRLTAAQLAYESDKYADAADLAARVSPTGGLAAQALLTQAWALYKGRKIDEAGTAFAAYAARFPATPERDESRLMSGQALLQIGRTADASKVFRAVADSARTETDLLQNRTRPVTSAAARALVAARAAGLLFISNTESGKTLALQDSSGAETAVLAAAFADSGRGASMPVVGGADLVSAPQVVARLDQLGADVTAVPRRVFFTPVSATRNRNDFAQRSAALYAADVDVAVARERLQQAMESQARQIALLRSLQTALTADGDAFALLSTRTTAARDSLNRLAALLDAAGVRLGQLFRAQVATTRLIADENARALDSLRVVLALGPETPEAIALATEVRTANAYRAMADLIERGIDTAITHHPVFALRDSVRTHGERIGRLLAEAEDARRNTLALIGAELARLEAGDNDAVRSLRGILASAESRRTAAETQVVAVVEAELDARAGELLASLRRDTEAAQFGSASSAFFEALDAGRPAGAPGTTGSAGGGAPSAGDALAALPSLPPQQK